ncbi:hypothetical protein CsSME_00001574 [Camellia sinensis var. sinensis]
MNKKLIGIVQLAGNCEGKIKMIDLGLDEMKDRVMKDESGSGSNLQACTTFIPSCRKSPIATSSTIVSTTRKVIITKQKVANVDQIINRFKATAKKQTKAKTAKELRFEAQAQAQAYALYYPYMGGMQNSMYVPVVNAIEGTSVTPSEFIRGTLGSLMNAPTQSFGSGSLTPSGFRNSASDRKLFWSGLRELHPRANSVA